MKSPTGTVFQLGAVVNLLGVTTSIVGMLQCNESVLDQVYQKASSSLTAALKRLKRIIVAGVSQTRTDSAISLPCHKSRSRRGRASLFDADGRRPDSGRSQITLTRDQYKHQCLLGTPSAT